MSTPLEAEHVARVMGVVRGSKNLVPGNTIAADIAASWRRCMLDYSLDLDDDKEVYVLDEHALAAHRLRHEGLIKVASAEIDWLYEHMAMSGSALVLTDANGILLYQRVDPSIAREVKQSGLRVGADWSESRLGTNGMGTCIALDRPIIVHRDEHYRSKFIGLSCTAAPIHDANGALVAALDLTTVRPIGTRETQAHVLSLVHMSAKLIEKCLFLQHFRATRVLRFHARPEFVNLQHDGALALDENSMVVAADDTALRLLGREHRSELVGHAVDGIFDLHAARARRVSTGDELWTVRDALTGRQYFASLTGIPTRRLTGPTKEIAPLRRLGHRYTLDELAGEDVRTQATMRSARRIAGSSVPVIIQGATGTGKELLARALHEESGRSGFVALNCAAIPESLIESELFGYNGGAFTGAKRTGVRGIIVQSSGGTLFLDEIGDMPLQLQTRLLRVLEQNEVLPLGGERAIPVDLRVICASHQNLRELIARGLFREDLYFRLNGLTLNLPAFSERTDKRSLIARIVAEAGAELKPGLKLTDEALRCLLDYDWPGNLRELRNVIRATAAIVDEAVIDAEDLSLVALSHSIAMPLTRAPASASEADSVLNPLERAERAALIQSIADHGGNMSRVAIALGMGRSTLYRRMHSLGIKPRSN